MTGSPTLFLFVLLPLACSVTAGPPGTAGPEKPPQKTASEDHLGSGGTSDPGAGGAEAGGVGGFDGASEDPPLLDSCSFPAWSCWAAEREETTGEVICSCQPVANPSGTCVESLIQLCRFVAGKSIADQLGTSACSCVVVDPK